MKILKLIGIILLGIVVLIAGFLVWNSKRQLISSTYFEKIQTGGNIEATYLSVGPYPEVDFKEIKVMENFGKYLIYYPSEMSSNSEKFPVIISSNGTGIIASRCTASLKRLASWGFIVIATDEEYSWNGFSSEMSLRLMIKLNEQETALDWESNPFYQSVDLDNIGVMGHSQGGVGAINAATDTKNGHKVKTIVSLSPANMEVASALEWEYDPALITVPTLLISGTGDVDETVIISNRQLSDIYNLISDDVYKFKIRRNDVDHGETGIIADGYVTAWFMWQLKGDDDASQAFIGDEAEILKNIYYQDVEKNF